ncbi:serine protease 1-like [Drosophila nasuta]|uniref:serine protease 1-like n=1 Tax=Drosophila nasuta TaxID=42062 RepID=UPI00295ED4B1|nr:serine protease 1-like [Drosophila nasuta]
MKFAFGILFLGVAFAATTPGAPSEDLIPDNIITNGYTAPEGKAPYIVFLTFRSGDWNAWCGGSIIGNNWVITASHCTKPYNSVTIYYGSLHRNQGQVVLTVSGNNNIINHSSDDIALIRTPHVNFNNAINRVRLPSFSDRNNRYVNRWTTACGWGRTTTTNTPDRLMCVDSQVISNAQCRRTYNSNWVKDQILCVSTTGGRSICAGDSGGPLVTRDDQILIGVTNFYNEGSCTTGKPSGFARVTSHLDWIRQHTGISY